METILITGAGKVGSLIACLLTGENKYRVHLADINFSGADITRLRNSTPKLTISTLNVENEELLLDYMQNNKITAVVSSLPYFLNIHVAKVARQANIHYFDLTEDTKITQAIREIAQDATTAFVPQCGVAPGFISIAANSLMQEFDSCHHAKLRVGALPQRANNAFHYSLTWSTDGVINEYGNPCYAIEQEKVSVLKPLEGLESIQIDGSEYEAFNTSGGLGSLASLYEGKIQSLNYKTIRYPGHCEKMRLLMNDLKLNEDRATLKKILEQAIPKTYQDMVIIYVSVEGIKNDVLTEKSYLKKIYPATIGNLEWSAIQVSTAAGVCVVLDMVLSDPKKYKGFVLQENFKLTDVLENRFGSYYQ